MKNQKLYHLRMFFRYVGYDLRDIGRFFYWNVYHPLYMRTLTPSQRREWWNKHMEEQNKRMQELLKDTLVGMAAGVTATAVAAAVFKKEEEVEK